MALCTRQILGVICQKSRIMRTGWRSGAMSRTLWRPELSLCKCLKPWWFCFAVIEVVSNKALWVSRLDIITPLQIAWCLQRSREWIHHRIMQNNPEYTLLFLTWVDWENIQHFSCYCISWSFSFFLQKGELTLPHAWHTLPQRKQSRTGRGARFSVQIVTADCRNCLISPVWTKK